MNGDVEATVEAQRIPQLLDLAAVAADEPPKRNWFVEGMVPFASNVLLAAHGGSFKSLCVLQMAVCIALGRPFFGVPVRRVPVMAVFAEDDRNELHRRLRAICASLEANPLDLA